MDVTLSHQEILYVTALDSLTHVTARSCIVDGDTITFLVDAKDFGQVIGKKGSTIKRVSEKLHKQVAVLPYAADAADFVRKSFPEAKFAGVAVKGNALIAHADAASKGNVLRNPAQLNRVKHILKKVFGVEHLTIIR